MVVGIMRSKLVCPVCKSSKVKRRVLGEYWLVYGDSPKVPILLVGYICEDCGHSRIFWEGLDEGDKGKGKRSR